MSDNVLNLGRGDDADERWRTVVDVVGRVAPDVLLMQEARCCGAVGSRLLFEAEQQLGMRGLLAVAPHTGQYSAVFFGLEIQPLSFSPDSVHFHHVLAQATLAVPGLDRPVTVASIHLSPLSPALRAAEVGWLAGVAAPGAYAVVAGDANSLAPGDPEATDWAALPAHFQVRYLRGGVVGEREADRSAVGFLEAAGFTNAAVRGGTGTPTVPSEEFAEAEFILFRSDHLLLSPALAPALTGYRVVDDEPAHRASGHQPAVVDIDPALLAYTIRATT